MQTHNAKRVAIIVEAPMLRRLTDAIEASGVTGYTIVPVIGGSGRSGQWSAKGQVSRAGGMMQVICMIRPERLDDLLKHAFDDRVLALNGRWLLGRSQEAAAKRAINRRI